MSVFGFVFITERDEPRKPKYEVHKTFLQNFGLETSWKMTRWDMLQ
jgi:hypothetical protein